MVRFLHAATDIRNLDGRTRDGNKIIDVFGNCIYAHIGYTILFQPKNVTSDLKAARGHTFWPPLYLVLKMAPIQYKVGIWKSVRIYYYHCSLNNHHMQLKVQPPSYQKLKKIYDTLSLIICMYYTCHFQVFWPVLYIN